VLIFGQQPTADVPAIGQPLGAASPAQHGLVQSGGQALGQQSGAASPAQHGLVQSSGQVFPQRLPMTSPAQHGSVRPIGQAFASNPAAAFCAHVTSAFSAKTALAIGHDVPPAAGQVLACEPAPDPAGKMFA